jgi:hypothetical protein
MALTAKLPYQPLTSHPSVRSLLEKGKERIQINYASFNIEKLFRL